MSRIKFKTLVEKYATELTDSSVINKINGTAYLYNNTNLFHYKVKKESNNSINKDQKFIQNNVYNKVNHDLKNN